MTEKPRFRVYRPGGMFNTLRRIHAQNLETPGYLYIKFVFKLLIFRLNNLNEIFQSSFMSRVRYLTVGSLRRTW